MAWSRPLPVLNSVWKSSDDYDSDKRIKILGYLPDGHPNPAGVEVQVLGAVHTGRKTLMALRDLRDNYAPEEVAARVPR